MESNNWTTINKRKEALQALHEFGSENYYKGYKKGLMNGFAIALAGMAILGVDWKLLKEKIKFYYEQES